MKHILLVLTCFALLSCDPCPDCGEPLASEPTVEMIFINQDSIDVINHVLIDLDSLDSAFTSINLLLVDFRDSVQELNDSIAMGLIEYEDERDAILNSIMNRQTDSTFLEDLGITDSISALTSTRSIINTGNLLINKLRLPEINDSLIYSDSATSWPFPLSFDKDFTIYEVLIKDETFIIELDYQIVTELDEERNIRVRADDIKVISTTGFDSLDICEQNCIDGEASFTFYF